MLIIGYVDNGGTDRYWIVLNSWGGPSNRPNGLFRLDMNMNYNAYLIDPSDGKNYAICLFQTMDVGISAGGGTCTLTKPTLVSPSGSASATPTYTWNAVSGAEQYQLWVDDSTASGKIQTWYTSSAVNCSSGTGTCSVTPTTSLASGAAKFYIKAWASCNGGTYSEWSDAKNFTVGSTCSLTKPTLISPSGSASSTPAYSWYAVSGAEQYLLWVDDSSATGKIQTWYTASQVSCSSGTGTCSITPTTSLASGAAKFYVRAWASCNGGTYSDWSAALNFTVGSTCSLTKPALISPSGTASSTPSYSWYAVSGAEQYLLYVTDSSASGKISTWYTSSAVNCSSGTGTCSVTPSTALAAGSATFWVRAWASCNGGSYSDWSNPMNFTVGGGGSPSAKVLQLYPVSGATVGSAAKLWAQVQNTGGSALPTDAKVWFYVEGGNISDSWVGYASAAGLAVNAPAWYSYNWSIPSNLTPGTYEYYARVYTDSGGISDWSDAQSFTISGGSTGSGFNEQFNGTSAPNWIQDSGTWTVSGGYYHANGGNLNANFYGTSTYKTEYTDCDYTALLYRTEAVGKYYWGNSGLIIRASGGFIGGDPFNAYEFYYHRGGKFSVWKNVGGSYYQLQGWTASSYINQGDAWNKLRVVAKGSNLKYYINDQLVWQSTDSSLSSGRVGFFFDTETGSADDQLYVDYAVLSTNVSSVQENLTEGQQFSSDFINTQSGNPGNPYALTASAKHDVIAPSSRRP